jgi:hypothetical protein
VLPSVTLCDPGKPLGNTRNLSCPCGLPR